MLVEIVKAEGPVTTERVYKCYAEANRKRGITEEERAVLDEAVVGAIRRGRLQEYVGGGEHDFPKTLYMHGSPTSPCAGRAPAISATSR